MNILLDGIHKFRVLFGGVGVVHTQIAQAAIFFGGAEINNQRLAVANVQIAVGLRRKPGVDGFACELPAGGDILIDKSMDKVFAFGNLSHIKNILSFISSWEKGIDGSLFPNNAIL